MALLQGHHIGKSFNTVPLFGGLNFRVDAGARIGLTGVNGCGKTTLFRIITGQMQPDEGEVQVSRETAIGYMEQQPDGLEQTLLAAVRQVFAPLMAIEQELAELNRRLENETSPQLVARQSSLQEELAERGGYTYENRLRATLRGLGFREEELQLPLTSLSGGQRSKAQLAKALLSEANLLLLDEPTNHLDIEALEWLEGFLGTWHGAFLIISHDRYFLDKLTNQTWELAGGKLYQYNGNYSASLAQKEAREESLRHRQESAKREARRIEGIIEQQRRFNQKRNYKTIASKQKQLARVESEVEALTPLEETQALDFSFAAPPPGGNEVLRLYDIAMGFGERQLFRDINLAVDKGERIFLLGPNGCGKTTLLRIVLGELQPTAGYAKLGVNIFPSYFDQMSSGLDPTLTILEDFTESFLKLTQGQIRSYLGRFLFRGEDVFKPIAGLSGGEKARLTLLKLMLKPANFLLLDEPSNHLDLASREAVENALLEYPGAMLVVSHDRYLINKLAQRICVLQPDGIESYLGNYDDYLSKQAERQAAAAAGSSPSQANQAPVDNGPGKGGSDYRKRKEEQSRLRKAKHRLELAEAAVTEAEALVKHLEAEIEAQASNYQLLAELAEQQAAAQRQLEACFTEWAEAQEAMEALNSEA